MKVRRFGRQWFLSVLRQGDDREERFKDSPKKFPSVGVSIPVHKN